MNELPDAWNAVVKVLCDAPEQGLSPAGVARATGRGREETTDLLCDLDLAGWLEVWEDGPGLRVRLSALAFVRLGGVEDEEEACCAGAPTAAPSRGRRRRRRHGRGGGRALVGPGLTVLPIPVPAEPPLADFTRPPRGSPGSGRRNEPVTYGKASARAER